MIKGEQDNGGIPCPDFFAPEKWKFPIPSAYNTGRVSFQTRSERMIIMTKGIVKIKKNRAFVRAAERRGGSGFRAVCVSESGKLLDSGGGAVFGAEEEVVF